MCSPKRKKKMKYLVLVEYTTQVMNVLSLEADSPEDAEQKIISTSNADELQDFRVVEIKEAEDDDEQMDFHFDALEPAKVLN